MHKINVDLVSMNEEEIQDLATLLHFHYSLGSRVFCLPSDAKKTMLSKGADIEINVSTVLMEAKQTVEKTPSLKLHICGALNSACSDLREITKIVLGVMIPLSLNGAQPQYSPLLIAGVALFIFNSTVAGFCANAASKS